MTKRMIAKDALCLKKRKQQAIELGIKVSEEMTLEDLEKLIAIKLDEGMKGLKNILDQI